MPPCFFFCCCILLFISLSKAALRPAFYASGIKCEHSVYILCLLEQGQLERESGGFVHSFTSWMLLHCLPVAKGPSLSGKGVSSDIWGQRSKRNPARFKIGLYVFLVLSFEFLEYFWIPVLYQITHFANIFYQFVAFLKKFFERLS